MHRNQLPDDREATPAQIGLFLSQCDLFSAVPPPVLTQAAAAMKALRFADGSTLMKEGDEGASLYLLMQGSVRLETRLHKNRGSGKVVEAPAIIGELACVTGLPRSASVISVGPVLVAELQRGDLDGLMSRFPIEMESFSSAVRHRLEIYQLEAAAEASAFLQGMSAPLRDAFLSRLTIVPCASGGVLIAEGDAGEDLYLVVSGRFRVTARNAGQQAIAELGQGDTIGELSLMSGDHRSATVVALRDSLVGRLSKPHFRELIQAYPLETMSAFSKLLATRSPAVAEDRLRTPPAKTMAVLALNTGVDIAAFAGRFASALEPFGSVLTLDGEVLTGRSSGLASESRLVEWLNDQENNQRHVLYQADHDASGWTRRCIGQADKLYLLVEADSHTAESAHRLAALYPAQLPQAAKVLELVLLHRSGQSYPARTRAWRAAFPMVQTHHHVRLDREDDFQRLARHANERCVGLTLGGGFALGIAHVGVVRALRELKVPIDCVGGTSMGAVIAAECAMEFAYEPMLDVIVRGCADSLKGDFTFPLVAFLSGAKLGRTLGAYLEHLDVEDFWLPYFSISASLRHAAMRVHTDGDALRSVLASCRAPGMFPPLPWGDDLLVDGGLVNNVPSDVMRKLVGRGTVIAVDVSPSEDVLSEGGDGLAVSGWKRARARWGAPANAAEQLTLFDVLGRIVRFGGVNRAQGIRGETDLYLVPPTGNFKALDFARGREIAEAAYGAALEDAGAWMLQHGRPWDHA